MALGTTVTMRDPLSTRRDSHVFSRSVTLSPAMSRRRVLRGAYLDSWVVVVYIRYVEEIVIDVASRATTYGAPSPAGCRA